MQLTIITTIASLAAAVAAAPATGADYGKGPQSLDWLNKAAKVTSWGMCCGTNDIPYDCVYADASEPTCSDPDFPNSYTCEWTLDPLDSTRTEQAGGIRCHFNNGPGTALAAAAGTAGTAGTAGAVNTVLETVTSLLNLQLLNAKGR
ncbi:hypothetical protein CNMCM6106_005856 [Aspergillus hiratsukae]|uniref:Uncharacterized protein n=1 Tax=Aspergillus hiratsukae TaxID=1194566 RepID=A0A8H6QFC7_9EURO|nr:hypothetical protein CNMCM6106_005856 [Aspergillus hiratsukae]